METLTMIIQAIRGCLNGMLGSGKTEEGETGEEQCPEHAHYFL
jgi:hypothetical protein